MMGESSARSHWGRRTVSRGLLRTIQQTKVQGSSDITSPTCDSYGSTITSNSCFSAAAILSHSRPHTTIGTPGCSVLKPFSTYALPMARSPRGLDRAGHICRLCGKSFGHKSTLDRHTKERHGGAPSKACPFCPLAFYRQHHLDSHLARRHRDLEVPMTPGTPVPDGRRRGASRASGALESESLRSMTPPRSVEAAIVSLSDSQELVCPPSSGETDSRLLDTEFIQTGVDQSPAGWRSFLRRPANSVTFEAVTTKPGLGISRGPSESRRISFDSRS
ncbi:unnamed protein product [Protopolystoma xenopodis]|uniref:C2H2-type domain-containing protein n=1 Tax=Protopolystoma xenopodis TaxID=117903 RepID=A0A3S5A7Y7_9PLAT|nr:unnamed protein product [Protopolystoma xenopodis]